MGRKKRGVKKNTHKVFILTCDGRIIPQDNWSRSSTTTYDFLPINLGEIMVTLLVDDNGRHLGLPINPFASFIKNGMLVGDCVVLMEDKEHLYETIQEFLEIRLDEMNSKPPINWIERDAENTRLLMARVNEMRSSGQSVIFLK